MTFGDLSSAGQALTLVDATGRIVKVPSTIRRIVCLGPNTLRVITYLNATDKVVGVEYLEKKLRIGRPYWLAHPEFQSLPVVGPGGPLGGNRERIWRQFSS